MDDELLKEVDEAVRQEKLHSLWNKFGNYIIAASVGIVLITVAVTMWKEHVASTNAEATAALINAAKLQDAGEYEKAAKQLGNFAQEHEVLQSLVKLREMVAWQQAGNSDKAIAVAGELTKSANANEAMKDFAAMVLAVETESVEPLATAVKPGRPFSTKAREIKAVILSEQDKKSEASALLKELVQDVLTSDSIRKRAQLLLTAMGDDDKGDVKQ